MFVFRSAKTSFLSGHKTFTRRSFKPMLEQLEDRLTPSWSGVPPTAITPPASAPQVNINFVGDTQGSGNVVNNGVNYSTFIARVSGAYQFSTLNTRVDTVLGVFNGSGQRLAYNDDISSSNHASALTVSLTAGSRYYFGITNYTGSAGGAYSWKVHSPGQDDSFETNNTLAQASNLGTLTASRTVSGLVMADGHDWFKFTMNGAGTSANSVSISFQNSLGDLDLELYNASGTRLAVSTSTSNSEAITLNGRAAGTYFVHVLGYNGATNPNYSLTINPGLYVPPPPPPPPSSGFHIDLNISGMTASQTAIFQRAAARWEQVITGDLPDMTYNGRKVDDLLIDARGKAIDGVGKILGQAAPDAFRSGSSLPYHGFMEFDTADLASLESNGTLFSVILHEMGHVLGIGTIWQTKSLLSGAGTSDPRFRGTQATAAYNQIFGRHESGVPVENGGGAGTRDSHWRESVLTNELMTGYIGPGTNIPLSRITIGSLADLGYQVNMNAADPFTPSSSAASSLASTSATGGMFLLAPGLDGQQTSPAPLTSTTSFVLPANSALVSALQSSPNNGQGQSSQQVPSVSAASPASFLSQSSTTQEQTATSATSSAGAGNAGPATSPGDSLFSVQQGFFSQGLSLA